MSILVRAACLTNYLPVARSVGLDPWALLRDAGLVSSCLSDPDLKIPVKSVSLLLERSAALSGVDAFSLLMADSRRVSNLGILGMLMREEPTVRHAMQSVMSYHRIHNEALLQRIEESQGIATIYEEMLLGENCPMRQATELVVAVALKAMRLFLGTNWRARRICFSHAAPLDTTVHRRVLGQTPEFGCDFNGIVCASADLDTPIVSADPVVAQYIRQQMQSGTYNRATVTDEVRQMVVVLMPRGRCTIEEVARLMGITRRTLHRHLQAEGQVFSDLVQAIRSELAVRYIHEKQRSLTDIAHLLGFANLSAFSRWHKTRFGCNAAQRRADAVGSQAVVFRPA